MNPSDFEIPWGAALTAFLASFAACWQLARLAPRFGWVDPGDGGRKTQLEPLAWIGGGALALALALVWLLGGPILAGSEVLGSLEFELFGASPFHGGSHFGANQSEPWVAAGLVAAFVLGLVDDARNGGLRPLQKFNGQLLVGVVLAGPCLLAGEWWGLLLVLATPVALNAFNTFDNADGASSSLALLGLAPVNPVAAAALLGFLPFNVRRSDGRALVGRPPRAILGDSGSHLLGMLVLVTPFAWPILALPLFDLARVSVERLRAGQAPWVGDRRHLAHRLERLGASPLAVMFVLLAVAAPSALMGLAAGVRPSPELVLLGIGASGLLFLLAVVASRPARSSRRAPSTSPAGS